MAALRRGWQGFSNGRGFAVSLHSARSGASGGAHGLSLSLVPALESDAPSDICERRCTEQEPPRVGAQVKVRCLETLSVPDCQEAEDSKEKPRA